MPGRKFSSNGYRYGFNGKEKDDEINSIDGAYDDFGARMYDSRLGRFMSRDPLAFKFASWAPYSFALNCPVLCSDNEGENPKVEVTYDGNEVKITVTNVVFVVVDQLEHYNDAWNAIGSPDDFYNGAPVNINIGGKQVTATITVQTIFYQVSSEEEANKQKSQLGYGVIAKFDPNAKLSQHSGDNIILAKKDKRWKADFAHELAHDWAGLPDLYVGAPDYDDASQSRNGHKFLVDDNDNAIVDLMNDVNSPLSSESIQKLAQKAVDNNIEQFGNPSGTSFNPILNIDEEQDARIGEVVRVVRGVFNSTKNPVPFDFLKGKGIFDVLMGPGNIGTREDGGKKKGNKKGGDDDDNGSHQNVRFL